MDKFKYRRIDLDTAGFRLLRLIKGDYLDPIQCELFEAFLDADCIPSFEALSYTWGGETKPCEVELDGKKLAVTENLALALRHLRLDHQDRILWADAICINQDDQKEKGHQVGNMRSVYATADRVLVWLGEATAETKILMRHLHLLRTMCAERPRKTGESARERIRNVWFTSGLNLRVTQLAEGLHVLLGRPWFRRVWVLQEVAFARSTEVICGSDTISGEIFAFVPSMMGMETSISCQAVLDIMSVASRNCSWWSESRDLYTLLRKFGLWEATDERDHVFALLGMANDEGISQYINTDYERPIGGLIHDTITYLLGISNTVPKECLSTWSMSSFSGPSTNSGRSLMQTLSEDIISSTVLEFRRTELLWAVETDNDTLAEALLESQASRHLRICDDPTTLRWAVRPRFRHAGHQLPEGSTAYARIVEGLLKQSNIDVNARDEAGKTALFLAVEQPSNEAIVRLLTEREGVDLNARDRDSQTPLSRAVSRSDKAMVRLLLQLRDIDVNARNKDGRTPLSWALTQRISKEVIMLLLEHKDVDVNARDKDGRTPLSWASSRMHNLEAIQLLLKHEDLDVNAKDKDGRTPLSWALSSFNGTELIQLLLKHKDCDINSRDKNGQTVLMWMIEPDENMFIMTLEPAKAARAQILLECTDTVADAQDKYGNTALALAVKNGFSDTVSLLFRRNELDINATDSSGQTALHLAVKAFMSLQHQERSTRNTIASSPECNSTGLDPKNTHSRTVSAHPFGGEQVDLTRLEKRYEEIIENILWRDDVAIDLMDANGRTALSWAEGHGCARVLRLFSEAQRQKRSRIDRTGPSRVYDTQNKADTRGTKRRAHQPLEDDFSIRKPHCALKPTS